MKFKILVCIILILSVLVLPIKTTFAEAEEEKSGEEILEEQIDVQLENMDFGVLEDLVSRDQLNITDEQSFKELVTNLIEGNSNIDIKTIFGKVISYLFKEIRGILPLLILIVLVAILGNIVMSFHSANNSKSVMDLTHFVCVAVVITLLVAVIKNVFTLSTNCVESMANQMSVIFPVLLTLLTAMGSVVAVGIYQPIVAILTGGATAIFKNIIFPIFILSLIFIILNNVSNQVKLNKFISFLSSSFKWIIGFVFTMFAGILAIQGISAGKYDTISLKATKFTMKSYIPIVGGYLSDGLDYVMLSSVLIKNSIGVAGLLILLGTIIVPIISILVLKLGLQFVSGVIEPMGNGKISNLCEDLSKVMVFPIVVILAIAFMYILSVGLIMCTISGV